MRIPRDVWTAVSAYAKKRESNNTAVVVAALRGFLDDAGRGVPELEEAVESRRAPGPVSKGPSENLAAPPSPRAPVNVPSVVRAAALPPARYEGCEEHPHAGALRGQGRYWCAQEGCYNDARRVQ